MDLMQLRDHLEDLVQQRTIELEAARDELEFKVKERTAELAESEEKYRLLVENANEAVIVFQDNLCKFFNDKAMELTDRTREDLASISFSSLVHPDDRAMVVERYWSRLRGEKVPNTYEFRIITKNGELKWIVIHAVSITWEGKPGVLALLTDITEHKSMEQELINYAHRITQVQEEERKRIAYELHDDTAQYLSILKLQLGGLLNSGKIKDPKLVEKLEFLEKDASRAVDDVRRYSHELRPGVLEHLGLRAAIEQIAEDVNKLSQIKVEVNVEGEEPILSEDVKLGFFRIAQEALNNCRKHAKASNAFIDLIFLPNLIRMSINDNGIGFDMKEAKTRTARNGNLGLMSMHERARLIGANLEIESEPGKGTTISVEKPL
jgi:PAS domain S-box-containing protein